MGHQDGSRWGWIPGHFLPESIVFLFTTWPVSLSYGMGLDHGREVFSLAYVTSCLFPLEGELPKQLVNDNPGCGVRVHQGLALFATFQGMRYLCFLDFSAQLTFPCIFGTYMHLCCPRRGDKCLFCFVLTKKCSQMAGNSPWSMGQCQSSDGDKALFLRVFQAE